MTVLPGSLDYLYYNGILDHIPYYAYEGVIGGANNSMSFGTNPYSSMTSGMGMGNSIGGYGSVGLMSQMNANQYMQTAQQGNLYNAYNMPDAYVRGSNVNVNSAQGYSFNQNASGVGYGNGDSSGLGKVSGTEEKSFRESIMDAASNTKKTVTNSPSWVKGLLATALMLGTFCLFLKKGKKPAKQAVEQQAEKTGFWTKLNSKNWFKKK